jgi:hypothetical protein
MRQEDLDRLSAPISESDARSADEQFHDALGLALPRWRALSSAVRADLDRDAKGVKWWTNLAESARQLISHQLVESLGTVPGLLARARIHLLEVAQAVDVLNADPHCLVVHPGGTGEPRLVPLRYESASEHLPIEFEQIHIAGVVHALFSALDVLGAVIIGVAGVPRSILKADLGTAMSSLATPKSAMPEHREAWLTLHQQISASLTAPADWHLWLSDLRNTVAHRAKIPTLHLIVPNGRAAFREDGDLVRFVNVETRLPRQPGRAFLQSFTANPHETHLDEPAVVTLSGLVDCTVKLVELVAESLAQLWERRRSGDLQLAQPNEQWKPDVAPERLFRGFAPGEPLTGKIQWATSPIAFAAIDGAGVGERK